MLIEGLYKIVSTENTETGISTKILLNKDHAIFKGHFPGNPVMPGVCMIQIIKELTEENTGKNLFLSVSSNIKFMAIINPEKNPDLQLVIDITEENEEIKVKNTTSYEETVALKLSATFKII
ncbi:3-hydroxymyristoyl/3-hydroxydecanoyl-(acyl carrier protein) dehydratase [Aequorivita sublithincola DSM 14238]|uniref:3-hydroxymyristoyl/3-hydroxydecanoyl-(Acyl carrier protein) dehydratase n=1 Tax=Aequorivita sublithincola (strain DSM 14238 / LMG 21431 / ACAM 643 / 9-3) TaxID=746697 RepID=I3YTV0_AEQSU|nr:3-hydroxyacyl-ACP dehydratase [Aequorivita sublithincola]AFL80418.1 3-hydroxymyristoyl/3-hydroxydecanoyl-(acyl carrier protein) dehydratase [Aequorivita sublithincola DSM 14238]